MFGLYLHLPFCRKRCSYCNFYLTTERGNFDLFLAALHAQVRQQLPRLAAVSAEHPDGWTVAFGGGTPSLAPPEWIASLLRDLTAVLGPAAEVSLEANPEDLDDRLLAGLRDAGITRLTLGVQTLDDGLLGALGRVHDAAQAESAVAAAAQAGFSNLGVDLIFGLPGQTPAQARADLARVCGWPARHISHYALEVEPATALGHRILVQKKSSAWADELEADFYQESGELLLAAGFLRYEVSNYARPGFASKHNSLYWTDADYLGLGPSAASYWQGRRWSELPDLPQWLTRFAGGRDPRGEILSPPRGELWRDAVAMGLRLTAGIDWTILWRKYRGGAPPQPESALADLLGKGLLRWESPRLSIHPDRQFLTEGIVGELLARVDAAVTRDAGGAAAAR